VVKRFADQHRPYTKITIPVEKAMILVVVALAPKIVPMLKVIGQVFRGEHTDLLSAPECRRKDRAAKLLTENATKRTITVLAIDNT
jgi:hypothetical protein